MPDPGRVVCARCGANNFSTQAACWKCGAPLTGGVPDARSPVSPSASSPLSAPAPRLGGDIGIRQAVDPAIAIWTGVILAILFPSLAIPVGMVFLMLDDPRKIEVGRTTLIWGIVFFVIHVIFTAIALQGAIHQIAPMLNAIHPGGGAQPGLNDPVSPRGMPSGFNMP